MAIRLTPEEAADKHARRLKGATTDIQRGIDRVTVAPGTQAAAKQDKMKANLNAKIDDGTWARSVKGVTLEAWKDRAKNVGVGRIAAGVDASMGKTTDRFRTLFANIEASQGAIAKIDDSTFEGRIQRMTTFATEMHKRPVR